MEVRERAREVVDRRELQVLDGARGRLHGRRAERRLAARREDGAVDAGRLGAPQERAEVLGILERIEDKHERRLAALGGAREDLVGGGPTARVDDERDPLVAVEAGDRGQRAALDLDDGDPQARRVQHELLERVPALRDDEQAAGLAARDERLLDRSAAGDELLALGEAEQRVVERRIGARESRRDGRTRAARVRRAGRAPRAGPVARWPRRR